MRKYHWEDKGLCREFSGSMNGDEVVDSNMELQCDPQFGSIDYVINDFTGIKEFIVGKQDIRNIAASDDVASIINPDLKIAIVASFEPLLEWIHYYIDAMQNSSFECKLFDNINDARKWVAAA